MSRIRIAGWLLATLVGLLAARATHRAFDKFAREFYLWLVATPLPGLGSQTPVPCEVETLVREISQRPPEGGVIQVGACDLFMYSGGVAASGFLTFLTLYALFIVTGYLAQSLAPSSWRAPIMLSWSLTFLFVALPIQPAVWLLRVVLVLTLISLLPLSGRLRSGLLLLAGAYTNATFGRAIVSATATGSFGLSGLNQSPAWLASGSSGGQALEYLAFGAPGGYHYGAEGYPYLFLALAFLLKNTRRILWLAYDLWVQPDLQPRPLLLGLYLVGLPTLLGNAATPSYREFEQRQGQGPDPLQGARTLALCLGLVPVLYVTLVMLGYSPAVRVLFPRCDIADVPVSHIWIRLVAVYVIEYLFLLATEQASIGVARLFGTGLKDNYASPLTARSMADYWRRWNLYWRDFLVRVFFWPAALGLARWRGRQEPWHLPLATGWTFLGSLALNLAPLLLLSGFLQDRFFLPQATQPGIGMDIPGVEPITTSWDSLLPSLTVYYALEGMLVSISLMLEARTAPRSILKVEAPLETRTTSTARRLSSITSLAQATLSTALTFALVAGLRVLLDERLTLPQRLALLRRAIGLD